MGANSSKPAAQAVSKAARSYPLKPSPNVRTQIPTSIQQDATPPPPPQQPNPATSPQQDRLDTDVRDPAFAARLHAMGIVPPNPFIPLSMQHHSTPTTSRPKPSTSSQSNPGNTPSKPSSSLISKLPTSTSQQNIAEADAAAHIAQRAKNPALLVFQARQRLQGEYDAEVEGVGRKGFEGRRFVEAVRIGDALRMRARGKGAEDIERELGLRSGTIKKLEGVDAAG